ncbi:hypothetical protein, partial [Flavobacterium sp. ACAM 123]|uniref:hypothetical protein n=1 Tax=Flavobacterium sp. ACAM 123 TaxID=1189620 RepID=UPI000551A07A
MLVANKWKNGEYYRITVNTSGYENLKLSYCNKGDTGIGNFICYMITGGLLTEIKPSYTIPTTSTASGDINLPIAANNQGLVYLLIQKDGDANNPQNDFFLDDITLKGTPLADGAVKGGTIICSGNTSGPLTLTGNTGAVVRWQSSLDGFATAGTAIVNTTNNYTSGALTVTTQFRAVVKSGTCPERYSAATTVTVNPKPAITAMTNAACSGVGFTSTPVNTTNGVVPTGTTY